MEYCNEGTLADQMKSKHNTKAPFTEEEIFKAFYEILYGYEGLWKKGILHQDLKP
jgi:serine/threonine protein kinase